MRRAMPATGDVQWLSKSCLSHFAVDYKYNLSDVLFGDTQANTSFTASVDLALKVVIQVILTGTSPVVQEQSA